MENIFVDNCPACEPMNKLINQLSAHGFTITLKEIEDYHFHQIHIVMAGHLEKSKNIHVEGISIKDNSFICNCHWSRLELINI